jgi:hypothetical protein
VVLALLTLSAALAIASPLPPSDRTPLQRDADQACRELPTHADQLGSVQLRRLDQLPWGHLEHAVFRTVFGCPVAEVVMDGQTYYVPSITWKGELDPATANRLVRHSAH